MYSKEVQHIIAYLLSTGVPFRVTDVNTPNIHSDTSYHYVAGHDGIGLAVDVAGKTPSQNSPELLRIFSLFAPVESQLAELIYSGAPYSIKNGRRVPRYAVSSHWNHVHAAVPYGTFLPTKGVPLPDDPNLHNITGPVSFHPLVDQAGNCTGYYIFSERTAELHSFGPGAKYYGRAEVVS